MADADQEGWLTSLITPAIDEAGNATQLVVGLKRNPTGGLMFALRIGADGPSITVPEQAAYEHMGNERTVMHEKLVREGRITRPQT